MVPLWRTINSMEYSIGDFSTISRLGIKTLRYYHEVGLLVPSRIDVFSGYRYYDETCLARVRAIQQLKQLDFSLAEIREFLTPGTADETLLQSMQKKLSEVQEQMEHYRRIHERLAAFVANQSLPVIYPDEVREKDVPDLFIASIRMRGRYSEQSEKLPVLMRAGASAAVGAPFTLYHDDHPVEEDADMEICLPVKDDFGDEHVVTRRLPGGHAVSILHHGPYEQIWVSYQAAVDYINRCRLVPVPPVREIYLKSVGADGQWLPGEELLTEIQFLVSSADV